MCGCVRAHVRVTFVPFPAITVGEADVPESIQRIEKLLNTSIEFHDLDLLDKAGLEKLFKKVRKLQERILLQDLRADTRAHVNRYTSSLLSVVFVLLQHSFGAVMHFAGLKAVGESVEQPLRYYRVNLTASINLLEVSVAGAACASS